MSREKKYSSVAIDEKVNLRLQKFSLLEAGLPGSKFRAGGSEARRLKIQLTIVPEERYYLTKGTSTRGLTPQTPCYRRFYPNRPPHIHVYKKEPGEGSESDQDTPLASLA